MHEKISALLDNELDRSEQDEVLKAVSGDVHLSAAWQRYHLIRAAIRSESIVLVRNLPNRMACVLSEGSGQARHRSASPKAAYWVPGLALAASITGLVGFSLLDTLSGTEPGKPSSKDTRIVQAEQRTTWETSTPDLEQTLNAYLVEHGEFTPMSSMNGLMAYAKFVSYDSAD